MCKVAVGLRVFDNQTHSYLTNKEYLIIKPTATLQIKKYLIIKLTATLQIKRK
jgi:hypothetical protein